MMALRWTACLAMMLAVGCATPKAPAQDAPMASAQQGQAVDVGMLIAGGEWFHMMEENHPDGAVYRRADAGTLPPARYRRSYVFTKGKCVWLALAPNDGHHYKSSACTIDASSGLISFEDEGEPVNLQIVRLDKDKLILR